MSKIVPIGHNMSVNDVAEYLNIDEEYVVRFVESNCIPHIMNVVNGEVKFKKSDVKKWAENNLYWVKDGCDIPINYNIYKLHNSKVPRHLPIELKDIPCLYESDNMAMSPCVYFLVDKGKVVYVGQTVNLNARLYEHVKYKKFDRVFYTLVAQDKMIEIERQFILKLNPKYNNESFIKSRRRMLGQETDDAWEIVKKEREEEEIPKKWFKERINF